MEFVALLQGILIVAGLLALSLGVYGIVAMPDIFMKVQATSKIVLLGLLPILVAAMLTGDAAMISRSVMMAVLLVLTTPIAAHAITKAAALHEARNPEESPGRDSE